MCNGLKSNYTVSVVDMSWNGLGYEGSVAVGRLIQRNNYLQEIDVSDNRINWEGAGLIAR